LVEKLSTLAKVINFQIQKKLVKPNKSMLIFNKFKLCETKGKNKQRKLMPYKYRNNLLYDGIFHTEKHRGHRMVECFLNTRRNELEI
jgi:hypothetical protein